MSPEVVESNPSGPETDLWSLGVVIYQMMVGYTPFLASSPYLSFLRIKRGFLRLPHFLDEATAEIITLLIHKDQKERFRNAAVMTQASPPPPADAGSGESSVNEETGKEIASAPKPSFSYDKLRNLAFFTKDPNFLFPDPFAEDKDAGPGAAVRVPSLSEIALRAVGRACLVVAEKIAANGGSRVGLESWIQVTPSPLCFLTSSGLHSLQIIGFPKISIASLSQPPCGCSQPCGLSPLLDLCCGCSMHSF
jgi:serine/threonine protein kinase